MPSGFGGTLTLYAVPQAKNVTLLGCYLHTGAPQAIQQRCDEIVSTLGLEGATAFPLAPTATLRRGAERRDQQALDAARRRASAPRPGGQGRPAGDRRGRRRRRVQGCSRDA